MATRLKYMNSTLSRLEDQFFDLLPADRTSHWIVIRNGIKVYPFSLHYILQCLECLHWDDVIEGLLLKIEEWSNWTFKDTAVQHNAIRQNLVHTLKRVEILACSGPGKFTSDYIAWSRVIRRAMDCDIIDLEQSMISSLKAGELVPSKFQFWEVQTFIDLLSTLIDRKTLSQKPLKRFLHKLVEKTGVTPKFMLLNGVRRLGENPVGGGGFADVWEGTYKGKAVALKVLRVFQCKTLKSHALIDKEFQKEALIWQQLRHLNVLPLYGICDSVFHPRPAMVSPWMPNGNILCYLQKNEDADRIGLVYGIAHGLYYLHAQEPPVVHGDLRGTNVLVDGNGVPKLADFGLACILDSKAGSAGSVSYDGRGSVRWQAPELLDSGLFPEVKSGPSTSSDVYAFASVCLEVFTEEVPFPNLREIEVLMEVVVKERQHARPSDIATKRGLSDEIWLLMQECWTKNPSHRPSMMSIVKELKERYEDYEETEDCHMPERVDVLSPPASILMLSVLSGELKRLVESKYNFSQDQLEEANAFIEKVKTDTYLNGFKFKNLDNDLSRSDVTEFNSIFRPLYDVVLELQSILPILHSFKASAEKDTFILIQTVKMLQHQQHLLMLPGMPYMLDVGDLRSVTNSIHVMISTFMGAVTNGAKPSAPVSNIIQYKPLQASVDDYSSIPAVHLSLSSGASLSSSEVNECRLDPPSPRPLCTQSAPLISVSSRSKKRKKYEMHPDESEQVSSKQVNLTRRVTRSGSKKLDTEKAQRRRVKPRKARLRHLAEDSATVT